MDREEIKKLIQDEIRSVMTQVEYLPDSVKQRHIGEGVRFIRAGTAANKPTSGEKKGAIYYETDTLKLMVWDGDSWESTTLS